MAAPTRPIHILRATRRIQLTELQAQPLPMLRLDASLRAAAKEALDAAVTKALDHGVYLYAIQATSAPTTGIYKRFQPRVGDAYLDERT
jgi:hypothetical protein